jgi:hypothetical protein
MKPLSSALLLFLVVSFAGCVSKPARRNPEQTQAARDPVTKPGTNQINIVFPIRDEAGEPAHLKRVRTSDPVRWSFDQRFGMALARKIYANSVQQIEIGSQVIPNPSSGWDTNMIYLEAESDSSGRPVLQLRLKYQPGEEFSYDLVTTAKAPTGAAQQSRQGGPGVRWFPYKESLFMHAALLIEQ